RADRGRRPGAQRDAVVLVGRGAVADGDAVLAAGVGQRPDRDGIGSRGGAVVQGGVGVEVLHAVVVDVGHRGVERIEGVGDVVVVADGGIALGVDAGDLEVRRRPGVGGAVVV